MTRYNSSCSEEKERCLRPNGITDWSAWPQLSQKIYFLRRQAMGGSPAQHSAHLPPHSAGGRGGKFSPADDLERPPPPSLLPVSASSPSPLNAVLVRPSSLPTLTPPVILVPPVPLLSFKHTSPSHSTPTLLQPCASPSAPSAPSRSTRATAPCLSATTPRWECCLF